MNGLLKGLGLGIGLAVGVAGGAAIAAFVVPNGFQPGSPISSSAMNANFEAIADELSDLGGSIVPTGAVMPHAGSVAPSGWLLCDGSEQSEAAYPDLAALLTTTYGSAANGMFRVPDLRGRVVAGLDGMGGTDTNRLTSLTMSPDGNTSGATGGDESHTLSLSEIPAHGHAISGSIGGGEHSHRVDGDWRTWLSPSGTLASRSAVESYGSANAIYTRTDGAHSHAFSLNANDSGGGAAHPSVQPTMVMNYIIKI